MLRAMMMAAMAVASPVAAAISAVGERAPALAAVDSAGKARTLKDVAGKNGTVLVFFRSASWCPYCKAQLIDLNAKAAAALAAKGYSLVRLSYDAPDVLAKLPPSAA